MTEEKIWIQYMKKNMIEELNNTKWKELKKCHIITLTNGKEYLKIPECVEELRFSAIFKGTLTNLKIPESVKLIYFNEYCKTELTDLMINNDVILHFERIPKISASTLPNNLKDLIINYLDFPLMKLPFTLEKLTVNYGGIYLEKSKIPYGCIISNYSL